MPVLINSWKSRPPPLSVKQDPWIHLPDSAGICKIDGLPMLIACHVKFLLTPKL